MADKIFLISDQGELEPMAETPYEKELDLQKLLATHWDLLPGEQIDPDSPRRWLLVGREISVTDSEDGADRWSVDHLFLDQDGVPTIVETKRSSDTRLRREVIGQLLEYAANAVEYWPVPKLIADFERSCAEKGDTPGQRLASFLGGQASPEATVEFWESVKRNLTEERIRLILVADEISSETRRIIEFLNGQMSKAEIIAIEIQQFRGVNRRALVPRVYGQTEKVSRTKKAHGLPPKNWSETLLLLEAQKELGSEVATIAKDLIDWITAFSPKTWYSGGAFWGRFNFSFARGEEECSPFNVSSNGNIQYHLETLFDEIFTSEKSRTELLGRVNAIHGTAFSLGKFTRYPNLEMKNLLDPANMVKFKETATWIIESIKSGRQS